MNELAAQIKRNSAIGEEILLDLMSRTKPGVSTFELNEAADRIFRHWNVLPTAFFLGAQQPVSIAVNEEVLFGEISREKILSEGDIVKLDLGVYSNGAFTDLGLSVAIEPISPLAARLLAATSCALAVAVQTLRAGVAVSTISRALESALREHSVSPIAEMCGHGIGRNPHEKPFIPPVTFAPFVDYEYRVSNGTVVCIEPFATSGSGTVFALDRLRLATADRAPAAFCEVPVLVTEDGPEVLAADAFRLISALREQLSPAM